MKAIVKRQLARARVFESDDPGLRAAPREDFIETMWSEENREWEGVDRDDYLMALRETWRRFYNVKLAEKRLRQLSEAP
jgi:hypothetical protein